MPRFWKCVGEMRDWFATSQKALVDRMIEEKLRGYPDSVEVDTSVKGVLALLEERESMRLAWGEKAAADAARIAELEARVAELEAKE